MTFRKRDSTTNFDQTEPPASIRVNTSSAYVRTATTPMILVFQQSSSSTPTDDVDQHTRVRRFPVATAAMITQALQLTSAVNSAGQCQGRNLQLPVTTRFALALSFRAFFTSLSLSLRPRGDEISLAQDSALARRDCHVYSRLYRVTARSVVFAWERTIGGSFIIDVFVFSLEACVCLFRKVSRCQSFAAPDFSRSRGIPQEKERKRNRCFTIENTDRYIAYACTRYISAGEEVFYYRIVQIASSSRAKTRR